MTHSKKTMKLESKMLTIAVILGMFSAIICGKTSYASTIINSEFEVQLSKEFQRSIIEKKWLTLQSQSLTHKINLLDQVVDSGEGVKIHLMGVSLTLNTYLQKPELSQKNEELTLISKNLQAGIVIDKIMVDQNVTQTMGGITGVFKVQAECHNIKMNLPTSAGQFSLKLKPLVYIPDKVNQKNLMATIGIDVEDISLSWTPSSWIVDRFECSGSGGFEQVIQQHIQSISGNSEAFLSFHKNEILNFLQKYFINTQESLSLTKKWLASRPDILFSLDVDHYTEDGSNIFGKGHLILEFTKSKINEVKNLKLDNSLASNMNQHNGKEAIIKLPESFIRDVLSSAYESETWSQRISSKNISAFSSLMNSRIMQFFVWPELMSFSKSSQFYFDFHSIQNPQIMGSGLRYQFKMVLLGDMWAPRTDNYVHFIQFLAPTNGTMNLSVSDGQAVIGLNVNDLKLSSKWDSNYRKKYDPSTYINISAIKNSLKNELSNQKIRFLLPEIPLMEGLTLKIRKIEGKPADDFFILLGP